MEIDKKKMILEYKNISNNYMKWPSHLKLIERYKETLDEDVLVELYSDYKDFIPIIARGLSSFFGMEEEDACSEIKIGMIKALREYDTSKKRYNSFLFYLIDIAIDEIKDVKMESWNLSERRMDVLFEAIMKIEEETNQQFSIENSDLVERLFNKLVENGLIKNELDYDSILAILYNREFNQLLSGYDVIDDNLEEKLIDNELLDKTYETMKGLIPRDEGIVMRRMGFLGHPMTYQEIGDEYGITRSRVRTIEKDSIEKIRKVLKKRKLM